MKKIIGLFFLLTFAEVNAQTTAFLWGKGYGGGSDDYSEYMTMDSSYNVYVTGHFRSSGDFDPGPGTASLTSAGYDDVYISKFSSSGVLMWTKSIGGPTVDLVYSITSDQFGNLLLSGVFSGTSDFDPGPGTFTLSATTYDGFMLGLDSDGNFLWAKKISAASEGPTSQVKANCIKRKSNGEILLAGSFHSTTDFDPGIGTHTITPGAYGGFFIAKYTSNGNFLWVKTSGGTNNCEILDFDLDQFENIYATGFFAGTVDFDIGIGTHTVSSQNFSSGFVLKLDPNASFTWVKTFSDQTAPLWAFRLKVDPTGNIFVTGYFQGVADFDPGVGTYTLTGNGGSDFYIVRLNPQGTFDWARSFGSNGSDRTVGICLDEQLNVYVAGWFEDTVDFDPSLSFYNLTGNGQTEAMILKLNSNGNFVWASAFGGPSFDFAYSIVLGPQQSIYVTGSYGLTADLDPGPGVYTVTGSNFEGFLCKLNQTPLGLLEGKFNLGLQVYPNPNNGKIKISVDNTNAYDLSIINIEGKVVYKEAAVRNNKEINLEGLNKGIYLLQLRDKENGLISKKIVIE